MKPVLSRRAEADSAVAAAPVVAVVDAAGMAAAVAAAVVETAGKRGSVFVLINSPHFEAVLCGGALPGSAAER